MDESEEDTKLYRELYVELGLEEYDRKRAEDEKIQQLKQKKLDQLKVRIVDAECNGADLLFYLVSTPFWIEFMAEYNNCEPKTNVVIDAKLFDFMSQPFEATSSVATREKPEICIKDIMQVQLFPPGSCCPHNADYDSIWYSHPEKIKAFALNDMWTDIVNIIDANGYESSEDSFPCFVVRLDGRDGIYQSVHVAATFHRTKNERWTINHMPVVFAQNFIGEQGMHMNGTACEKLFPKLMQMKESVCEDLQALFSDSLFSECFLALIDMDDLPIELIELVLEYLVLVEVKPPAELDPRSPKRQRIE